MAPSSSRAEHFSVCVVLGVLAVTAVGGLLAGWYEHIYWYDEVVRVENAFGCRWHTSRPTVVFHRVSC